MRRLNSEMCIRDSSTYFLIPSPQDPVLADPKVRRAVSLAINRQTVSYTHLPYRAYGHGRGAR